jgi:hypothetical protein
MPNYSVNIEKHIKNISAEYMRFKRYSWEPRFHNIYIYIYIYIYCNGTLAAIFLIYVHV